MKPYEDLSLKWQNANNDIKSISLPISLDYFPIDKYERNLGEQFQILAFMTRTDQHVGRLYKHPNHFPYNRHNHLLTFNETRVAVGVPEERDQPENYLHANFIEIMNSLVIATQGPMTSTFYNFWRAVEQYSVKNIFMLCKLMQKEKIKCDRYYPLTDKAMVEKNYEIRLLKEGEHDLHSEQLKLRRLQLRNNLTGNILEINHWQILDWPDNERPSNNRRTNLLLDELLNAIQNKEMSLVHCSAGVGRTGTFIAMAIIRLVIQNHDKISIFNEVRKMREQRWGMVQSACQYEHLYDFAESQINVLLNSSHSEDQN